MATSYDFVIFGASPAAALVSGLLAHDHGAQVLRVADPVPRMRLSRSVDVALPFATRPATWRLLRTGVLETARLLAEIEGADRLEHTSARIVADLPQTAAALAHMTHTAAGYGAVSTGGLFRRVARLVGTIELGDSAVQTVETARVGLATSPGKVELTLDGDQLPAGRVVLADDAAILERLAESDWPRQLRVEPMLATLTLPAKRLPAGVVLYPDRGVTLAQGIDGSVLALVDAQADAEARLGSCLPGPFPLQRRGTTHYRRLLTTDGAQLLGQIQATPVTLIAGLGSAAAFFAPALARWLAGASTEEESAWFFARDPLRDDRAAIADIVEARP